MMGSQLRALFLDWVNNYTSVEVFSAAHGLSMADAKALIEMGRRYHEDYVEMMEVTA
jgi:hypothetical protein